MSLTTSRLQFFKSLAIVVVGGVFAGMVLLCLFFASELSRLVQENGRLTAEKRALDFRMNEIESNFKKINAYSDTLDELTLATVAGDAEGHERSSDRITAIREALQRVRHYSSPEEAQMNMILRADEVVANTGRLAQTLRDLVSILEHRREILDATPTLTPTTGWISSFYGERHSPFSGKEVIHRGIDIGAEPGTPVYAPAEGVVDIVGKSSSFGNFLVIEHPYGIMTKYAHNKKVLVEKGQRVKRGQVVAEVGSTGRSTGPHLHYEVWVGRKPVDPRNFLLDQKLKVVNLVGFDSIGGEEFDIQEDVKHQVEPAKREVSIQRFSKQEPLHADGLSVKKKIGIALLLVALGLLGYLILIMIRDRQERTIYNLEQ